MDVPGETALVQEKTWTSTESPTQIFFHTRFTFRTPEQQAADTSQEAFLQMLYSGNKGPGELLITLRRAQLSQQGFIRKPNAQEPLGLQGP